MSNVIDLSSLIGSEYQSEYEQFKYTDFDIIDAATESTYTAIDFIDTCNRIDLETLVLESKAMILSVEDANLKTSAMNAKVVALIKMVWSRIVAMFKRFVSFIKGLVVKAEVKTTSSVLTQVPDTSFSPEEYLRLVGEITKSFHGINYRQLVNALMVFNSFSTTKSLFFKGTFITGDIAIYQKELTNLVDKLNENSQFNDQEKDINLQFYEFSRYMKRQRLPPTYSPSPKDMLNHLELFISGAVGNIDRSIRDVTNLITSPPDFSQYRDESGTVSQDEVAELQDIYQKFVAVLNRAITIIATEATKYESYKPRAIGVLLDFAGTLE